MTNSKDKKDTMAEETEWGVPRGKVAQRLREILYGNLTDHDVEAIVVCLLAHLLVEDKLNGCLYRWLLKDAPSPADQAKNQGAKDALWKNILGMDFVKKWNLIKPFFSIYFPDESKNVWDLNTLRVNIFHGKLPLEEAKFKGQPISRERTVEEVFIAAQEIATRFNDFEEIIDGPHGYMERMRSRLRELGEEF